MRGHRPYFVTSPSESGSIRDVRRYPVFRRCPFLPVQTLSPMRLCSSLSCSSSAGILCFDPSAGHSGAFFLSDEPDTVGECNGIRVGTKEMGLGMSEAGSGLTHEHSVRPLPSSNEHPLPGDTSGLFITVGRNTPDDWRQQLCRLETLVAGQSHRYGNAVLQDGPKRPHGRAGPGGPYRNLHRERGARADLAEVDELIRLLCDAD